MQTALNGKLDQLNVDMRYGFQTVVKIVFGFLITHEFQNDQAGVCAFIRAAVMEADPGFDEATHFGESLLHLDRTPLPIFEQNQHYAFFHTASSCVTVFSPERYIPSQLLEREILAPTAHIGQSKR